MPSGRVQHVSNGIYIIEQHEGSVPRSLMPELAQGTRISWDNLDLGTMQHGGKLRLLVVNTVGVEDAAVRFFEWLATHPVGAPVCAILAQESGDRLLQRAADVADEVLLYPMREEEWQRRLARLLGSNNGDSSAIAGKLAAEAGMRQMLGQHPAFLKAMNQIVRYARTESPVLLTGETGTGKELGARLMHLLSSRQEGPFIPVDCGALPDHFFENEIFGHSKGAFADAHTDQKGLVALAQSGTLFLDEIDCLSMAAQSMVLHLLQEQTYRPLGCETFHRADVRILAATNRDLEELVERKLFRPDLFLRIHVLRVRLPALRDRRSDIALLSRHFIEQICAASHIPKKVLSQSAIQRLEKQSWPGNIPELYNMLQRAVICSDSTQITAMDLTPEGHHDDSCEVASDVELQDFRQSTLEAIQTA